MERARLTGRVLTVLFEWQRAVALPDDHAPFVQSAQYPHPRYHAQAGVRNARRDRSRGYFATQETTSEQEGFREQASVKVEGFIWHSRPISLASCPFSRR